MSRHLNVCLQDESRLSHCLPAFLAVKLLHMLYKDKLEFYLVPTPGRPLTPHFFWKEQTALIWIQKSFKAHLPTWKWLFSRWRPVHTPPCMHSGPISLDALMQGPKLDPHLDQMINNKGHDRLCLDMLLSPENLEMVQGGNTQALSLATSCSSVSRWLHSSSWVSVWERQSHAFKEKITWITL